MINSQLQDGTGSKQKAKINGDNALYTTTIPYPPVVPQKVKPFRQYFTDDGTLSGSNDMGVDGSATNVDFYVQASETDDRYITNLSVLVGYGGAGKPFQFADSTALTNGMRLFYESQAGEVDIHDAIKSNQDFFRLTFDLIPTSWEVRHVDALNDYGYFMNFDLTQIAYPLGVKLDRKTQERLVMCVRDDATNADSFNVIAYGFDRFE